MFWITDNPPSGSLVQCLAKNYKNDSITSVDMNKVGVIAAHSDPFCVCVVRCILVPSYTVNYTHTQRAEYAAITPTLSIAMDTIESFL